MAEPAALRAAPRPWAALLLLLAALLPAAAPEKDMPNRPLRMRAQSPDGKLPFRWKPPYGGAGLRSPRSRSQGYLRGYGESSRRMSYAPLLQERQNQEARKLASESVHVVSLPSRSSQGRSQPVYRSSLTKRKVTEEEEVEVAQDITVRVMSSQSVLVAWTDPLYEKQKVAANRQYNVRYREKGESARWDYKQVSNRRALVEHLLPDTMYEFAVQILEGEKEGKWSVSVYQRTPEAAPSSAPENLDVWPLKGKPTSVAASWDALPESEGKVKEYILSYAPALKPFGAKSITYSGATTSAIIDGLQAGERYIFKIRAANRRGPGPQSKAFSVAIPAAAHEDSVAKQQTNIPNNSDAKKTRNAGSSPSQTLSVSSKVQPSLSSKQSSVRSPNVSDKKSLLSEYKNKILTRGVLSKSQLPSRKTEELEPDLQSTEVTDGRDSSQEASTTPPKAQDQRRNVRPLSPGRPVHPVLASGRTSVQTHTSEVSRQTSTDKRESPALLPSTAQSSASSVPKYTDNETKKLRQSNTNVPSETSSQLLPAKNNDLADNVEGKPDPMLAKVSSKISEPSRMALPSNRQSAISHEVVPSHPSRAGSLGHSLQPSSKSADSHGRDSRNEFDSEEAADRAVQPSSRSQQTRLPSGSSSHTWKDSKLAAAAVQLKSAVSGQNSPQSRSSTSAKSNGKDKNYRENSQEASPLSRSLPSSRQSSSGIYSKRKNPQVDSGSHLRETHGEKSPHSDSEEQQSRAAAPEKHSPLQSSFSKHKPEEDSREVKEMLAQSKPSISLPKKVFSSHLPLEKTSHSEPPQRAQTSPSLLHSRGRRLPSHASSQSNEELQEGDDEDVTEVSDRASSRSVFPKEVSSSRGLPASFSQGSSSSSLSKQQQPGSQVPSYKPKLTQPHSSSASDTAKDNQYNPRLSSTSSKQAHPSLPTRSRVATRTVSQTEKKYGLLPSKMSKAELPRKAPTSSSSKSHQSVSNEEDDYYNEYDQKEVEEKTKSLAARLSPSISRGNKNLYEDTTSNQRKAMDTFLPHKVSSEEEEKEKTPTLKTSFPESPGSSAITSRIAQSSNKHTPSKPSFVWPSSSASTTTHNVSPTVSSTLSPRQRLLNSRLWNPSQRQFVRPPYRQGYNGRPNLTTKNGNGKIVPGNNGKPSGQRVINGPQGTKWIVDLDRGLVLNVEGKYLQDSQGNPLRVKLGGDGRTIVDEKGAPVVSPDGLPLFGHSRFSKPVASAQDKPIISLGGKPLIGLEMIKKTTTPSTTTTTTPPTTTTTSTTTTTTTVATTTTTTPEPTTTEPPTEKPLPTCPPGTYGQYDDEGNLLLGFDGLPDCNAEDTFSGLDSEVTATPEAYVIYDDDYEFFESTLPPTTAAATTTTASTTTELEVVYPETSVVGTSPVSAYDIAGKKRFTAPYVTYLNKDPAAPCSLTEALEHFQVESLDEIIPNDLREKDLRPLKAPHNITVVAVEGCHSFVIVDWAKPARGDMVTGYLVYSASYDDFLKNKWSTRTAGSTHLPIENLKPNTRYYFKVQAKNPFGYGPVSSSVSFITESDNPLLIVRPPGGEPIWIPFTFKYDPTYSDCSGKQYVKRTWYRKFVGVVLCNSLRYKIYLSDDLKDTFYSIGDSWGRGEDHCQFVDSHLDGRTGPQSYVEALPTIRGYYRQYRQEPVSFGRIGHTTPYYYVGWYECGVPIPGKW
ncbi:fibronectin type III domain-containing protein 1 [Pezoporus flaviventris]|uniref:fibronectin type III domain-containing protein 1 n=1 Tax=Pezoporus flaviventris TaxID=889875 RepID=UPI002AB07886|nr:fibronectin type III domain-containing protein 1 [Pezoporus flaviventris]